MFQYGGDEAREAKILDRCEKKYTKAVKAKLVEN